MIFIGNQYEEMRSELAILKESKPNVAGHVDSHVTDMDNVAAAHHFHLHRLEGELNKFQQSKLSLNLVITGFLKIDSPVDTFWGLITSLKATVSREDVSSIHILNAKAGPKRKRAFNALTLLVTFSNIKAKVEVIKKKKDAGVIFSDPNGNDRRRQIYIRDHLTKYGMFLFEKAQQFKTEFAYEYLWTRDGRILICKDQKGKTVEINSLNDLHELHRRHVQPNPKPSAVSNTTIAPASSHHEVIDDIAPTPAASSSTSAVKEASA